MFDQFIYWHELGTAISGILIGVMTSAVVLWRKRRNKKTKDDESERITVSDGKHSVINEELTILRMYLKADRTQVCLFHNGGKFLDGKPMKRMSMSHESCGRGVSSEYMNIQGLLNSLFWELIENAKLDDPKIWNIDYTEEPTGFQTYALTRGIKYYSILPLKNDDLYIGFLRADWSDDVQVDQNAVNEIMNRAKKNIEWAIREERK